MRYTISNVQPDFLQISV